MASAMGHIRQLETDLCICYKEGNPNKILQM